MANRLSQIATRTGDAGTTGLGNNQRVSKNSLRIHAMGDVDELNSHIGLLLCEPMPDEVRTLLVEVQHQLFNLGGELSIPGFELLKAEAVLALDEALAHHNAVGLDSVRIKLCAAAAVDEEEKLLLDFSPPGRASGEPPLLTEMELCFRCDDPPEGTARVTTEMNKSL